MLSQKQVDNAIRMAFKVDLWSPHACKHTQSKIKATFSNKAKQHPEVTQKLVECKDKSLSI